MIRKCCILVCNDPEDQAVFTKALHDVSPETICLTASNAIDAIYMMTKESVEPDFIFIEFDLPQMNAIEFLTAIKSVNRLKDVHVIVHATSPLANEVLKIKESGALAIYLRPYEYYGICNMLTLYFTPETAVLQQN